MDIEHLIRVTQPLASQLLAQAHVVVGGGSQLTYRLLDDGLHDSRSHPSEQFGEVAPEPTAAAARSAAGGAAAPEPTAAARSGAGGEAAPEPTPAARSGAVGSHASVSQLEEVVLLAEGLAATLSGLDRLRESLATEVCG